MRVKRAYFMVLILSLLLVDEPASSLFRPASAIVLFNIPLWLRIFRYLSPRRILNLWNKLSSFLRAHGGRLHIGDIVDGLSHLHDYFKSFGYLNSTLLSNFTNEFSADLESAIKYFQTTFHLNVTGQPDNATFSLITLPRCSLPDIINGSTTMSFNKLWPDGKKELTYAFSPENEKVSLKGMFADAFRRWSEMTMLNFTETTSFNESDIQILFLSLDGRLGVVGGAWLDNRSRSWDVVLDSDEKWVLPNENMTESDQLDLESAVMHQIGHVLGLNHSSIEEAVMYPFMLPSKNRKVDFAKDDLERIQQIYGTKSNRSELSTVLSPSSDSGVGVGEGPGWGLVSTLWLGVTLHFWF